MRNRSATGGRRSAATSTVFSDQGAGVRLSSGLARTAERAAKPLQSSEGRERATRWIALLFSGGRRHADHERPHETRVRLAAEWLVEEVAPGERVFGMKGFRAVGADLLDYEIERSVGRGLQSALMAGREQLELLWWQIRACTECRRWASDRTDLRECLAAAPCTLASRRIEGRHIDLTTVPRREVLPERLLDGCWHDRIADDDLRALELHVMPEYQIQGDDGRRIDLNSRRDNAYTAKGLVVDGDAALAAAAHLDNYLGAVFHLGSLIDSEGATQMSPIDVRPKILAMDRRVARAVNVDAQGLAELLARADRFSEIPDRRAASACKRLLLLGRHRIEEDA